MQQHIENICLLLLFLILINFYHCFTVIYYNVLLTEPYEHGMEIQKKEKKTKHK